MTLNTPCKNCGSKQFENFSPSQIRCTQCGNISLLVNDIKISAPDFQLSIEDDLLDFEKKKKYIIAPLGKRFVNYIIDIFGVFGIVFIGSFLLEAINFNDSISGIGSVILLFSIPSYYVMMEYKFGKTLGKLITKTKVVSKDGNPLSLGQCIGRLFCRIIPFERFSGLFSDGVFWHDSIPGTLVVED